MYIATVNVLNLPYHVKNEYDYLLLPKDAEIACVGDFVAVPFGNGNKETIGLITEVSNKKTAEANTKTVHFIFEKEYSLSTELYKLCKFISANTFCTLGDSVRAVFPMALLGSLSDCYKKTDKELVDVNETMMAFYSYLVSHPGLTAADLCKEFGQYTEKAIHYLKSNGYIEACPIVQNNVSVKYKITYSLAVPLEKARGMTKSPKAIKCAEYLDENTVEELEKLRVMFKVTRTMLDELCCRGMLKCEKTEEYRSSYLTAGKQARIPEAKLTEEQEEAYKKGAELIDSGKPAAALLYGVTGSGKTRVIKALCDKVISNGKSVIMLVPEISLTPQSTAIFCACYGERVAVIHSSLSPSERIDAWKRIKRGMVDMVIGTRSAVFAPLSNLGMIVIDEEQEHTYKSEQTPKYHARDIARFRCAENNAFMLLSSATPSIESFYKAQIGKYTLLRLMNRYGSAGNAKVTVADMREDFQNGITDPIGTVLKRKIIENRAVGNQSILFLNRRGYSSFLNCRLCGGVIMCPNCDISMTYHTFGHVKNSDFFTGTDYGTRDSNGYLMCHSCGYKARIPEKCPECGSEHIAYMGYGTQRIEDDLKEMSPSLRILRMDADTTGSKMSYERILGSLRKGEADLLLGTQMVTKGHDFPNVTLVGVLLADFSLYLQDFRANERAFSLLTQVIGRAGRGDKPGEAVIQTFNPENEVLKLAKAQDYETFYKGEIALRKAMQYPPFCDMTVITFSSDNEEKLSKLAHEYLKRLIELRESEYSDVLMILYGPFEASVYRMKRAYRLELTCKCKMNCRTRELFSKLQTEFIKKSTKNENISIDVNPL